MTDENKIATKIFAWFYQKQLRSINRENFGSIIVLFLFIDMLLTAKRL